ncbi:transposase [Kaistella montana]|nr:transposase [Kaistella montana]MCQ4034960.1 transposase [Kaistella montana]
MQRFERNISILGRSKRTFDNYSRHVAALVLHFGKVPTELDPEDLKDYLFELQKRSKTPSQSYFKHTVYGLRFLLMTLSNEEFTRRFSLHILPKRFVRIRHYGILSSSWKRGKLQTLQSDLKIKIPEVTTKTLLNKCRCCGKGNLVTIEVFGQRGPPQDFLFVTQPLSAE